MVSDSDSIRFGIPSKAPIFSFEVYQFADVRRFDVSQLGWRCTPNRIISIADPTYRFDSGLSCHSHASLPGAPCPEGARA
eukprot:569868-Pyramimonas_sp.AAC.1